MVYSFVRLTIFIFMYFYILHSYIPTVIHAGITDLVEARLFNRVNDGEVFRERVCELLEGPLHVGLGMPGLRQLLHLVFKKGAGGRGGRGGRGRRRERNEGGEGEEGEEREKREEGEGEEGEGRFVLL